MDSGENSKITGNSVKESKGIQDTEDLLYLHFTCVWVDPECPKTTLAWSVDKIRTRHDHICIIPYYTIFFTLSFLWTIVNSQGKILF